MLQPLYLLLNFKPSSVSKKDLLYFEADLLLRIYSELKEIMRKQNLEYFRLIKLDIEKEDQMLEIYFMRSIIKDILVSEEYTLSGIAYHSDIPEDVVYEIAVGLNTSPTFTIFRKIIEIHRTVRPQLYLEILKKIIKQIPVAA